MRKRPLSSLRVDVAVFAARTTASRTGADVVAFFTRPVTIAVVAGAVTCECTGGATAPANRTAQTSLLIGWLPLVNDDAHVLQWERQHKASDAMLLFGLQCWSASRTLA